MTVFRVEIRPRVAVSRAVGDAALGSALREAGLSGLSWVGVSRLVYLEGALNRREAERIVTELLVDPVAELATVTSSDEAQPTAEAGGVAIEIHRRPGVMDPEAESTLAELRAEGLAVDAVRTARRFVFDGVLDPGSIAHAVCSVLANDCIEQVVLGTAGVSPGPRPPAYEFQLRTIPLSHLDDAALVRLAREGHLFLAGEEMRTIREHFKGLRREPTDVELETIAQTWSEHCIHKTLRSRIVYRGAALPGPNGRADGGRAEVRHGNLLHETIVRATEELIAAGRGPECLSVFKDNAGVIAFDDRFGVAFKVETHNHPSAIEPYGGATTGLGGVIRDVIGCGLGARPVASTDVFCVAPSNWPAECLPAGVLHPQRVLRGIVRGVADYGNRMGIPTVNGAVYFDPRYLGNPLVFCGSVGLIPRGLLAKAARPGDQIVVIGGRTGRDGIHGATFSSAELTDKHAEEFSHAVQIGNAITEKRVLDAVLQARDVEDGCLYTAITDCGAGGLSSAVGEMAEHTGAAVHLDQVPLKYAGLRYDEIWISEAQERMVLAVPPERLAQFLGIMEAEEVEASVIGVFGSGTAADPGHPRIVLRYADRVVGELEMAFLHGGCPRPERVAEWWPENSDEARADQVSPVSGGCSVLGELVRQLGRPSVASEAWILRQYDHEVQGGSVVKPLLGPGCGPSDAAVLRPRLGSQRGIVLGCGLVPHLADVDPYWMAVASIDEAVRNVICVGGDPDRTALLDNFCWGRSDDPRQLGALVRACHACYDVAMAFGAPFISGKDSLNNEFALGEADVEPLLEALRRYAGGTGVDADRLRMMLPVLEQRVRERRRLAIPPTLLISAVTIVEDVQRCVTPDLKRDDDEILLVGGLPRAGFALRDAARIHRATAELIRRGLVVACHDVSDGGWLVALAEMAVAGDRGAEITVATDPEVPFAESCAAYVVETPETAAVHRYLAECGLTATRLARVTDAQVLAYGGEQQSVASLRAAWAGRPQP